MSDKDQETSFLEMSDEDLFKAAVPAPAEAAAPAETVENDGSVQDTDAQQVDNAADAEGAADETGGDNDSGADSADEVEKPTDAAVENQEKPEQPAEKPVAQDKPADASTVIDYKAEYERLVAPFKANGRDIQVKNVDDAISLMQMGANYNKKMAGLKPSLKILKLLENNGLLDEGKLGFLIDLDKRNPEAINKLVKDSGLDPLDLSAEKAGEYKPGTYTVDEREMELDAVLEDLKESPGYNRTLEVVSTKWDGASKSVVAKTPQILNIINAHVEAGIYDQIMAEVESERTFGRLKGLSDLEAYKQVGDAMDARGAFANLGSQKQAAPAQVVQPKPKQVDEDKLRDKRRAASSTKATTPATVPADYNPLSLPDEELAKFKIR